MHDLAERGGTMSEALDRDGGEGDDERRGFGGFRVLLEFFVGLALIAGFGLALLDLERGACGKRRREAFLRPLGEREGFGFRRRKRLPR